MKRNKVRQQTTLSPAVTLVIVYDPLLKDYCSKIKQESFILSWITTNFISLQVAWVYYYTSKNVLMYVILRVHHYQYILKKTLLYFFLLFSMFSIRLLIFYNSSRVDRQFTFSTTLCTPHFSTSHITSHWRTWRFSCKVPISLSSQLLSIHSWINNHVEENIILSNRPWDKYQRRSWLPPKRLDQPYPQ